MKGVKDVVCQYCGKSFTKRGIKQHISRSHPSQNPSQSTQINNLNNSSQNTNLNNLSQNISQTTTTTTQINNLNNSSQTNPSQNDNQNKRKPSSEINTNNKKSKTETIPNGWKTQDKFDKPISSSSGKPFGIKNDTCYNIFTQYLNMEILEHFVEYTNLYSIKHNISFEGKLLVVDINLIKKFIGVIYLMGLIHFPSTNDYFRSCTIKNPFYHCPFISKIIKRELFYAINEAFHFDILALAKKVNTISKQYWKANVFVTVDEIIIPFKGRWKGRQHVFGKPHSTGIKLFSLCDGDGYMYHFWIYLGKDNPDNEASTVEDYVLTMVKKLPKRDDNLKYVVLADQFFGSATLAKTLITDHNVETILSCRCDRPTDLFKNYLQKKTSKQGDTQFLVSNDGKLCALTMYDSSKVNIISSVGSTEIMNEARKRKRPGLLIDYNKHMNSVDRFDSTLCLYLYKHRKRKWTRACCYGLLKLLLVNSYVAKNSLEISGGKKRGLEQRKFIEEVVLGLCTPSEFGVVEVKQSLQLNVSELNQFLINQHFPIIPLSKDNRKLFGVCIYCKQLKSHTSFKCNACNQFIHPKCFVTHMKEVYLNSIRNKTKTIK